MPFSSWGVEVVVGATSFPLYYVKGARLSGQDKLCGGLPNHKIVPILSQLNATLKLATGRSGFRREHGVVTRLRPL